MYLPIVSLLLAAYLAFLMVDIVREDDLCGKIRNKKIVSGAKAVFAAVCCLLAVTVAVIELGMKGEFLEPCFLYTYYGALLGNAAIGFVAGVVLWKAGIWPAGDAKLYALICAALPLIIPYTRWSPKVMFLTLLVNIFLPAAVVYLVEMSREQLEALFAGGPGSVPEKVFNGSAAAVAGLWRDKGKLGLFLFTMLLFGLIRAWESSQTGAFAINDSLFFALLLVSGKWLEGFINKLGLQLILLFCLAAAGCAVLFPGFLSLTQLMLHGLVKSSQVTVFRWLFYLVADRHLASRGTYRIKLGKLLPGMIVSGEYLEQIKKEQPEFMSGWLADKCRDGLTSGQISQLEGFLKNKTSDSQVETGIPVLHVKPFAFYIALGGALTIGLSGKNILVMARSWLEWVWRTI